MIGNWYKYYSYDEIVFVLREDDDYFYTVRRSSQGVWFNSFRIGKKFFIGYYNKISPKQRNKYFSIASIPPEFKKLVLTNFEDYYNEEHNHSTTTFKNKIKNILKRFGS
jgi:hypothetical protein